MGRSLGREARLLDPRAVRRARNVGETEKRHEYHDEELSIQRILPERASLDPPAANSRRLPARNALKTPFHSDIMAARAQAFVREVREEDHMRAKAFILINLAAGVAGEVYSTLSKMQHVEIVHAVSGPYDMIAVVDGSTFNEIGRFVIEKIQTIPGVRNTITCNAIFLEN
jgi:DNA-binding Lrp family transcriptional regulator